MPHMASLPWVAALRALLAHMCTETQPIAPRSETFKEAPALPRCDQGPSSVSRHAGC